MSFSSLSLATFGYFGAGGSGSIPSPGIISFITAQPRTT
jgi:hypothetical protein